ncbi:MAG: anaerobic ribonucleoside-triphosphate reductase, partial [Bacteroidaceae bacterium]
KCGSDNIDRLQRITGYLVGTTDRWNKGKLAELNDRVTHVDSGNQLTLFPEDKL